MGGSNIVTKMIKLVLVILVLAYCSNAIPRLNNKSGSGSMSGSYYDYGSGSYYNGSGSDYDYGSAYEYYYNGSGSDYDYGSGYEYYYDGSGSGSYYSGSYDPYSSGSHNGSGSMSGSYYDYGS